MKASRAGIHIDDVDWMMAVTGDNGAMSDTTRTFNVSFEVDEDGVFIAECIDLPGCHAHGATKDAAREQLREVIAVHLDVLAEQGRAIPHVEVETLDLAG